MTECPETARERPASHEEGQCASIWSLDTYIRTRADERAILTDETEMEGAEREQMPEGVWAGMDDKSVRSGGENCPVGAENTLHTETSGDGDEKRPSPTSSIYAASRTYGRNILASPNTFIIRIFRIT